MGKPAPASRAVQTVVDTSRWIDRHGASRANGSFDDDRRGIERSLGELAGSIDAFGHRSDWQDGPPAGHRVVEVNRADRPAARPSTP